MNSEAYTFREFRIDVQQGIIRLEVNGPKVTGIPSLIQGELAVELLGDAAFAHARLCHKRDDLWFADGRVGGRDGHRGGVGVRSHD